LALLAHSYADLQRAAQEAAIRELAIRHQRQRMTLRDFAPRADPRFRWWRHVEVLGDALERVVAGEIRRLMVYMPPRHGKSMLASRILPAYFLSRHPDRWVGLNSYSADLARTFSRSARDHYIALGGQVRDDAGAVTHWETVQGGGMWAAGAGGPITGKGFHLGLIDDPLKNAEEASSEVIREKQKEWYRSTFATREEPGGAIVVTMTRWDEDDLAGWLLSEEAGEDGGEGWHIIHLPAIADAELIAQWPEGCTVEPDWRSPGEALCPERYPLATLERLRRRVGEYYWLSLYQQVPRSTQGKGRVYHSFTGVNVAEVEDPGECDLLIGMDFNVDPMSACVAVRAADQLHVFDEIELRDSGTEEMCREIKARWPGRRVRVCPDPSGQQRRTSAAVGDTDFAILRRHGFQVSSPPAAPPVVDRINEVNALADEGEAGRRLYVHPRCRALIAGLQRLIYKPGTSIVVKGKYDHMTDALGYLVHQEFPLVESSFWGWAERMQKDRAASTNGGNGHR
jgi:hypothetical protein